MLTPLYGFVHGDVLGVLVLVQDDDTIAELAGSLSQAAAVRVAPFARPAVYHAGQKLEPTATVRSAGLTALARVELVEEAR